MTTLRSDERHSRDMALHDSYDVTDCLDSERAASTIQVRDGRAHRYNGRALTDLGHSEYIGDIELEENSGGSI